MAGNEWFNHEERDAVMEIMDRGGVLFRYGFDERRKNIFKVKEFEQKFASYIGTGYAQAVTSGSTALRVALGAAGIGAGDEVIAPCFTFVATVESILESGATPVIADIDETLNISPEDIEKRITAKTKAIVPVHMLGAACDMNKIMEIARKHNLLVIEDTAQACGSTYFGKKLGSIGAMGTYSFDYVKTLTCGEGGIVVTSDKTIYERSAQFADHGHMHDPSVPRGLDPKEIYGFNFRMTELQAAIGLVQLGKLPKMLETQRANKNKIKEALTGVKGISFRPMADPAGDGCDTLIMVLKNPEKAKAFAAAVAAAKIGTKILPDALGWHFFGNWPQIYSRIKKYAKKDPVKFFTKSKKILNKCVAIPINLNMDQSINGIIDGLKKAAKESL